MNLNECFEKRLLKRINPDLEKSKNSLKIAESKLSEAKKLFEAGFFNNSIVSIYTSMFHASRCILYKDGIQEKSHYAIYIYLKEKYSKKITQSSLNSLNLLREERHEILYGIEENMSSEETENSILDAEKFLEEVKKIYD